MEYEKRAYLIIEKGEPYGKGTIVPLVRNTLTIGRIAGANAGQLSVSSPYVSRRHALVEYGDGIYRLTDCASKNGTRLNNEICEKNKYYALKTGDRISLAHEDAVIVFHEEDDPDTMSGPAQKNGPELVLDDGRREVIIGGVPVELSGNLYALLKLLYDNRGRAVSHDEIKKAVWPERAQDERGVPLATDEEILTNILRLRKKFADHPDLIRTLRGYGYRLDRE